VPGGNIGPTRHSAVTVNKCQEMGIWDPKSRKSTNPKFMNMNIKKGKGVLGGNLGDPEERQLGIYKSGKEWCLAMRTLKLARKKSFHILPKGKKEKVGQVIYGQ